MFFRMLITALAISGSALFSLQNPAEAAEFRSGVEVVIGPEEVLNEYVYVVASRIVVDGTVDGDLLAAGESIAVNGAVNGDLIIAARSIAVSGVVKDDVRAAAAVLRFQSSVGEDLIVAGDQIELAAGAMIGQDLVARGNTLDVSGDVEGNLDLEVTEATIAGTVGGNVEAIVEEQLTLGPDAKIAGALNYTSTNEVSLQPGAEVLGDITQGLPVLEIFGNEFPVTAAIAFVSKLIGQIKWFIGTLLVGLTLIWLYPTALSHVIQTFTGSPFKSLGIGIVILPLMPLVFLIMMIAILSSVGFSAFPVVAIPATVYAALLLLAKPIVAILIGDYFARGLRKRENPSAVGALAFGAAMLAAMGMIPYVDSIVGWLTLLSGFGMWLLYLFRRYRAARLARTVRATRST